MTALPHSAGLFLWANLLIGATAIVRAGFDAAQTLAGVESYEITWAFLSRR